MKSLNIIKLSLIVVSMLISLSISSQVSRKQVTKTTTTQSRQSATNPPVVNTLSTFWYEDFGSSSNGRGDIGNLAGKTTTKNGPWSETKLDTEGQKNNKWYISSSSAFTGLSNCSEGILKNNMLDDRTLHIAYDYRIGEHGLDVEAIYAKNESSATDCRIETPVIDCSGKQNISLTFDYFTGGIVGQDFFSLYYFDGTNWSLISNFGPSYVSPTCDSLDRATWKKSDTYVLPISADGNPEVKIGFRWINSASIAGNSEMYSVAIDNISLSDSPSNDPSPVDPTSSTSRTNITRTKV